MSRSREIAQLKRIEAIDNLKALEHIGAMAKKLTVAEVVEKLGGLTAVAEMFHVGETAVMNWRTWNKFPKRLHLDVYMACQKASVSFDPRKDVAAEPQSKTEAA